MNSGSQHGQLRRESMRWAPQSSQLLLWGCFSNDSTWNLNSSRLSKRQRLEFRDVEVALICGLGHWWSKNCERASKIWSTSDPLFKYEAAYTTTPGRKELLWDWAAWRFQKVPNAWKCWSSNHSVWGGLVECPVLLMWPQKGYVLGTRPF